MKRCYLDYAATAPLQADIAAEMHRVGTDLYGNPSSLHEEGKQARMTLDQARNRCADALDVDPERLLFTSGGTESNAIPLNGLLHLKRKGRICISGIEHPAVWTYAQTFTHFGFEVTTLPADARGIVTPQALAKKLTADTVAVALMAVNNESGAIQPLREAVEVVRSFEKQHNTDIRVHTDAVQALGKIPLAPEEIGADTMAFSAHKLGGPKGTGLLYHRQPLQPLSPAGGQEDGQRGGTENVAAIHALSLAVERSVQLQNKHEERVRGLKQYFISRLAEIEGVRIMPASAAEHPIYFSPYILTFSVAPVPGEVLVRVMNDRGFAISTGSACSARSRNKQHRVLRAMGITDRDAAGAVRVSYGPEITRDELNAFCDALERELPLLLKTAGRR